MDDQQLVTTQCIQQRKHRNEEELESKISMGMTMNSIITNGKPISGIYINNTNQIIITFRENKIIKGIILYINWQFYEWYCNMKYFKIKDHDNVVTLSQEIVNQSIGCLLPPKLTSDSVVLPLHYCIVFSDWRKI